MPRIYYECVECMNEGDGTCYHHNEVRLLPSGDWICESCYENAGQWSYRDKPADWPDDQDDRWHDLPPVPKYAPETA